MTGRLYSFLAEKCPEDRMPGKHWVWTSLVANAKRIATLIVLANQHAGRLESTTLTDSYLSLDIDNFPVADDELGSMSGCYLNYDSIRRSLIRAGMTETSFEKRYSQHRRSSRLNDAEPRRFYLYYPHKESASKTDIRRGFFEDLEQRVALGVPRDQHLLATELFDWPDHVDNQLGQLKFGEGRGATKQEKRYKHLCYMFESFFAVALAPRDNITQNPGFEWQLQLYSKKN